MIAAALPPRRRRLPALLRALRADRAAISAVEFALVAPLVATLGLGAVEVANMVLVYTRVSQVAMQIADNASRVKQANGAGGTVIRDADVNDLFGQADLVYPGLGIYTNGRVILSSLEQNGAGGQWIHWQRCRGNAALGGSKYGTQGTGSSGTGFAGMGPTGTVVTADAQSAVMFVELYYKYQPIAFPVGNSTSPTIYRAQAMVVRDDRDLTGGAGANNSGIVNPTPAVTVSSC